MKKASIFFILILFLICGCASQQSSTSEDNAKEQQSEEASKSSDTITYKPLEYDDIGFNLYYGVSDDGRMMMVDVSNNTDYVIKDVDMIFTEKEDASPELKEEFFNNLKNVFSFWDDSKVEEMREKPITFNAYNHGAIIHPHETAPVEVFYYKSIYYLMTDKYNDLVEPDYCEIVYSDTNQIYTSYYDFKNQKLTTSKDTKPAFFWSDYEIGNAVPKPDAVFVEEYFYNKENKFGFKVYGIDKSGCVKYIEQCENMGYTFDDRNNYFMSKAKNEEGYQLEITLDEPYYTMTVQVDSPQ